MTGFTSLTASLEEWFDEPLSALPAALQQRIKEDFFPMPWNTLSADQRRSVARQWDANNDPALEHERKFWWDFFIRKGELEEQIARWTDTAAPTASDLDLKEKRLLALREELAQMESQERQDRGDFLDEQASSSQELPTSSIAPVSAAKIILEFQVLKDFDQNDAWWKKEMRGASRNDLAPCRVGAGKKGPGGSLWRPELIAGWLIDRDEKGLGGMSARLAAAALKRFPGGEEVAERFFKPNSSG